MAVTQGSSSAILSPHFPHNAYFFPLAQHVEPAKPLATPKDQSTSTLRTVTQVRSILLTRLPYELVDIILTEAQYFAVVSTKRVYHLRVQASNDPLHNAKWVYMISDPIPHVFDGERVGKTKVQYVVFRMRSCDQGCGGFSEGKSTFFSSLLQE
jgi:hypothetical protein